MAEIPKIVNYDDLIKKYEQAQADLMIQMEEASKHISCGAQAGQFLILQFKMGSLTQIGESISNMISQLCSIINNSIRNIRSS
jgi:hypothetical protein